MTIQIIVLPMTFAGFLTLKKTVNQFTISVTNIRYRLRVVAEAHFSQRI